MNIVELVLCLALLIGTVISSGFFADQTYGAVAGLVDGHLSLANDILVAVWPIGLALSSMLSVFLLDKVCSLPKHFVLSVIAISAGAALINKSTQLSSTTTRRSVVKYSGLGVGIMSVLPSALYLLKHSRPVLSKIWSVKLF
jgi:hypothetical protein